MPVAQDARLLLCQFYCPDDAALTSASDAIAACFSGLAAAKGVHDGIPMMTTEWLKSGSPEDLRAPGEAVSFFVQAMTGRPRIRAAFHAYYRAHHVPIVFRMPGIRSVSYYLPTSIKPPPGRPRGRPAAGRAGRV